MSLALSYRRRSQALPIRLVPKRWSDVNSDTQEKRHTSVKHASLSGRRRPLNTHYHQGYCSKR